MSSDTKNLEKRGMTWYAVVEVPPSIRGKMGGKRRLKRTLKTGDVRLARDRRHLVVAEFRRLIARARQAPVDTPDWEVLSAEAAQWVETLSRDGELLDHLVDRAKALEPEIGIPAALAFYRQAMGKGKPLYENVERWLEEGDYRDRTKSDHRAAINRLRSWMAERELLELVETITSPIAGEFVAAALRGTSTHIRTANKIISGLSSYWRWMQRQGFADNNPWSGKSLPTPRRGVAADTKERPFTDAEMVALFNPPHNHEGKYNNLRDLMLIGALSGMRIEEICQLRVMDVADELFTVNQSKTRAGTGRKVPIHPDLEEILSLRTGGEKGPRDYLFSENKPTGWDGARSMAASKRFGTYRKAVGVDEQIEGHRRGRVNYHSFRRWFVTKFEEAGVPEHVAAKVVGHKSQTQTYGGYSGAQLIKEMREAVRAVKLPPGCIS